MQLLRNDSEVPCTLYPVSPKGNNTLQNYIVRSRNQENDIGTTHRSYSVFSSFRCVCMCVLTSVQCIGLCDTIVKPRTAPFSDLWLPFHAHPLAHSSLPPGSANLISSSTLLPLLEYYIHRILQYGPC